MKKSYCIHHLEICFQYHFQFLITKTLPFLRFPYLHFPPIPINNSILLLIRIAKLLGTYQMPKSLLSTLTYFMSLNPCSNAIKKIIIFIPIFLLEKIFGSHIKQPKFNPKLSDPVPSLFNPSALLLEIQLMKYRTKALCHRYQGIIRECPLLKYQHPLSPSPFPPLLHSQTPWTACFKCPVGHFHANHIVTSTWAISFSNALKLQGLLQSQ